MLCWRVELALLPTVSSHWQGTRKPMSECGKPSAPGALAVSTNGCAGLLCSYIQAAKVNERFERIYVLQAMEEARCVLPDCAHPPGSSPTRTSLALCSWARRHKEQLDRERAWMADQPDWVVARNVYYTDKGAPTSQNPLDPRTLSDLNPN